MECTIADIYYNTHCDREIADWCDARHVFSTLRRTTEGIWYLHVRMGEKQDITPLTTERAQELLQQRNMSAFVRWFGERVKKAPPPSAAALKFG